MSHKTHIHGFKLSLVQENLSSGFLLKFSRIEFRYDTFQIANSKGAEQSVWMLRLLYAFVVHTSQDSFSCIEDHVIKIKSPHKTCIHGFTWALTQENRSSGCPTR